MGDTTFNGWTYTKIGTSYNVVPDWDLAELGYLGCIRDEGGRWLYVPAGSIEEYPLLDLSGGVGDVVTIENPHSLSSYGARSYRVQSIVMEQTVLGPRRMWTLVCIEPNGWPIEAIEGIGPKSGLIGHGLYMTDGSLKLSCMQQQGSLVYNDPISTVCPFLQTGTDEEVSSLEWSFMPNPVSGRLLITGPGYELEEAVINVLDASGRRVHPFSLSYAANTWSLDVSQLSPGAYILSIAVPGVYPAFGRMVVHR